MKRMENREPGIGNEQPVNAVRASAFARFPFPVFHFLFSILLSVAAFGAEPAAMPVHHAPEGYGKATFGMALEQVRQLYPALAPAPAFTAAAYFRSPNLKRYLLAGVEVRGLKSPCNVELRFWKNQLWNVITFYGANPFPDVVKNLEREYGPPTTKGGDPTWVFGTATLITSPDQLWYSVDGADVGKDVQREFMEVVRQQEAKKAAHTPAGQGVAATPAP